MSEILRAEVAADDSRRQRLSIEAIIINLLNYMKRGDDGDERDDRLRYVKRNIRVNAIAPDNVRTGITERAQAVTPPEAWLRIERANPIGRLIEPEEIAELVVWLCSDQAALVNGTLVAADTGWHVA
jgi:enoyl-[acyl-carrier-protein] reductase (NADH)